MPRTRDELADLAIEPIRDGMIVGLGTGRAATRALRALAERVEHEGLDIRCVATSQASERLGDGLGLAVEPMSGLARLDYLFDGADEVDPAFRMIKGLGGAMTQEKIVARATDRRVYLVQRRKLAPELGLSTPLPIEVMLPALTFVRRSLDAEGLRTEIRREPDGTIYETDNHNTVLHAALPAGFDPDAVAMRLDLLPGVVGHGLFLTEADEVLVEDGVGGPVERLVRAET